MLAGTARGEVDVPLLPLVVVVAADVVLEDTSREFGLDLPEPAAPLAPAAYMSAKPGGN